MSLSISELTAMQSARLDRALGPDLADALFDRAANVDADAADQLAADDFTMWLFLAAGYVGSAVVIGVCWLAGVFS